MWFLKYFMWGTKPKSKETKKKKRDKRYYIKMALLVAAVLALLYGCVTCGDCTSGKGRNVERIPAPVTNLSVVVSDGAAQLYWTDSTDYNLVNIEVSWTPNGGELTVLKGLEKYRILGLQEGVEYTFTVRAVDKWGNKSNPAVGGAGKGFWQRPVVSEDGAIAGITGVPTAGQITLGWTNLDDSEYDYIEIRHDPSDSIGSKTSMRIPKGVDSKTLVNLTNDTEYTFYVVAVDSQGNRKPLKNIGLYISDHATTPESAIGRTSGNQVDLTWQDPDNAPFDHIEVSYIPKGATDAPGSEKPVVVDKGTQTVSFTGLSDVNDYEFTVYAVNTFGQRRPVPNVKLSALRIPRFDGRDAPYMVVKGVPVAGQVILSWDEPEMENLDHVAILYEPEGRAEPITVEAGVKTKTILGLADGREYSFLAYAVNADNSNRVITGLQLTTPVLPRLIARAVSGRATLMWSDPRDPALDYINVSYSPDGAIPFRVEKGRESITLTELSDSKEYEFKVSAEATTGNTYAVIARVIVPQLPMLTGTPVNRQLSISWVDPANVDFDHIEIIYSPGGDRAQVIAKGVESRTIYNLIDNQYTFTIYARDRFGNRHAVESPRFFDPRTAFVVKPETAVSEKVGDLKPLNWRTSNAAAVFGESSVNGAAYGVASNGSARWVAGGGEGKIAYSNDYGLNWTQVTDSGFGFYSVDTLSYGNGRWVAGGKNGRLAWSANGTAWNVATKTQTVNNNINTVAYGDGRWMAGAADGVILSSEDNGATWRVVATDVFGRSSVNTIVYHGGRWLAGGAGGKIAYSNNNGLSWTAVGNSTFGSSIVNVIMYDKERWVAGGYGQRAAWSEDGVTWKPLARPFFILCMGTNDHRWIIGGQEGRMAWSGDGGENWVTDEQGQSFFGTNWIQSAASGRSPTGGRRWLVTGQSGKIIFADEQF